MARAGLLLCSHGVYGGPGAAAQHAAAIGRLGLFAETRVCCLKGRPGLAEAVEGMDHPVTYLVPLLMAEGYTAQELLGRALVGIPAASGRVIPCRPVGANPRIAEVIAAAARRSCRTQGWAPEETTVVVMGHGTKRAAASGSTAVSHAEALACAGEFAGARAAFLDQSPSLAQVLALGTSPHTVVVGLFADRGAHGESDVPRLLTEARSNAVYAGPIGTAPELSDLVLEQVTEMGTEAA